MRCWSWKEDNFARGNAKKGIGFPDLDIDIINVDFRVMTFDYEKSENNFIGNCLHYVQLYRTTHIIGLLPNTRPQEIDLIRNTIYHRRYTFLVFMANK